MNLNYAIFRSEPIITIPDLAQIGSHNKREKKAYQSNKDIKINLSKNNIELVPLNVKYVKGFDELTKEYKKEHDERMKTERADRKKRYHEMLNSSKNVVADELVMTASHNFFKDMSREQIKEWADTCMEFVYKDLGYKKEQVLHATVHLDEKTPHIHCVVVPLVMKLDYRTNTERYTISKKQYIKDKIQLSQLQDMYHKRLTEKGYDLERGIKGSDRKHIKIKEYKRINRELEQKINVRSDRLTKEFEELDKKMESSKSIPFDKKHIVIDKDTFDTMNQVINESKKIKELEPKIKQVFNEVNNYADSYKSLEKENQNIKKEVKLLKNKNEELEGENKNLQNIIKYILDKIKMFFRNILLKGNETSKDLATQEVKDYYDYGDFQQNDIIDVARGTTKEDELFDYAYVPDYHKTTTKSDDFEINL